MLEFVGRVRSPRDYSNSAQDINTLGKGSRVRNSKSLSASLNYINFLITFFVLESLNELKQRIVLFRVFGLVR